MIDRRALAQFARSYLTEHPEELVRMAKNVALLRFGVPLEVFRFLTSQLRGKKAPRDVLIEAAPPGIRMGATLNAMKTELRAELTLIVERVALSSTELRFELRIRDVVLAVLDDAESPVAALIKSGALDLSKPGNLVAYMPKRPPMLIEAKDDRVVVDLMRDPKISRRAGKLAAFVTPLVSVKSIETELSHLDVYLECFPDGFTNAVATLRDYL